MKKEYKTDLWFVAAQMLAIVIAPPAMDRIFDAMGLYGLDFIAYLFVALPLICFGITLLHVAVTGRFSGLYLGTQILFLLAAGICAEHSFRPQDTWGEQIGSGLLIGGLLMIIPMICALIEALGVFVRDRICLLIQRHRQRKLTEGTAE